MWGFNSIVALIAVWVLSVVEAIGRAQCENSDSAETDETGLLQSRQVTADQVPQELRNIGVFGHGYNIFQASPFSGNSDAAVSSGQVFEFHFSGHTTPDGRFVIPDGTNVISLSDCAMSATSSIIDSAASYSKLVASSVGRGVGVIYDGIGGAGSTSASFEQVNKESQHFHQVVSVATAKCIVYRISAQGTARTRAKTTAFGAAVDLAATSKSAQVWYQLFDTFGTNVITSAYMGSQCSVVNIYTEHAISKMSATGISLSQAASISATAELWGVNASVSQSSSLSSTQRQTFESVKSSSSIACHGPSPAGSANLNAWRKMASTEPRPVHFDLQDICTAVDSDLVEGCTAALNTYCEGYLKPRGQAALCPARLAGIQPCFQASDCDEASQCVNYECQKPTKKSQLVQLARYVHNQGATWCNIYRPSPCDSCHPMQMWVLEHDNSNPAWSSEGLLTLTNCIDNTGWFNTNSIVTTSQACAHNWAQDAQFNAWSKGGPGRIGVKAYTDGNTNTIYRGSPTDGYFYVYAQAPQCNLHPGCRALLPGDEVACCPTAEGEWLRCCER